MEPCGLWNESCVMPRTSDLQKDEDTDFLARQARRSFICWVSLYVDLRMQLASCNRYTDGGIHVRCKPLEKVLFAV